MEVKIAKECYLSQSMVTMNSIFGERDAIRTLGAAIRKRRLHANLSAEYVADALGISRPTYRKIEDGDGTVEFRHVARAIAFFDGKEALANVVASPLAEPTLTIKALMAPERQRAGKRRAAR